MRIVLCYPVEQKHKHQIQTVVPQAELVDAGQERVAVELPTADIFCGHPKVPVPWAEVSEKIEKQARFDSDIWAVEIEDRTGLADLQQS